MSRGKPAIHQIDAAHISKVHISSDEMPMKLRECSIYFSFAHELDGDNGLMASVDRVTVLFPHLNKALQHLDNGKLPKPTPELLREMRTLADLTHALTTFIQDHGDYEIPRDLSFFRNINRASPSYNSQPKKAAP